MLKASHSLSKRHHARSLSASTSVVQGEARARGGETGGGGLVELARHHWGASGVRLDLHFLVLIEVRIPVTVAAVT